MVKCGNCTRRTLTGEYQKSHTYYRCHGERCQGVSWRSDVLEGIALDHIRRVRLDEQGLGDLVEDIYRGSQGDREMLRASVTLRLQHLGNRLTRLTDLLIDNTIDTAAFNARKEKLLIERQGILEELARADGRSPLAELFEEFERNNRKLLRYEMLTDDEKPELIDIVCSNFSIQEKSSTFTLHTPYQEIAEIEDLEECAHRRDDLRTEFEQSHECAHNRDRDNVRMRRILDILKNMAENEITSGNVTHLAPSHISHSKSSLGSDAST